MNFRKKKLTAMLMISVLTISFTFMIPPTALGEPCITSPKRLVSWWSGDGNANDVQDKNPGILQNGASYATGKVGQAFSMDGIDDFVEVADITG